MSDSRNFVESVPVEQPKRSAFNLSHQNRMTAKLGKLYPIMCEPAVPGDTFQVSAEAYVRLAPMLAPMFGNYEVEITHYFVPNRLLWKNWQKFITGGVDGQQTPSFPRYRVSVNNCQYMKTGTLADYLGYNLPVDPTRNDSSTSVKPQYAADNARWGASVREGHKVYQDISALPFRAYQLIYDTYWADENSMLHLTGELASDAHKSWFEDGGIVEVGWVDLDNPTSAGSYAKQMVTLRSACYRKDYFTAALPWTQRGGAVTLPLAGDPDVYLKQTALSSDQDWFADATAAGGQNTVRFVDDGHEPYKRGHLNVTAQDEELGLTQLKFDPGDSLAVDLSMVTASTINDLRAAFALQRWLEKNAVGGSRYIEQILMHFGVRDKDARLQRPEYLTGSIGFIRVNESLQTSQSTDASATPQGNPIGVGNVYLKDNSYKYTATEHGYFMSLMVIRPRANYFQGLKRDWFKFDRNDFLWPEFAHLGEQAVYKEELLNRIGNYDDGDFDTFGYMPRYSEYRFCFDSIHGDFKDSLYYWHNSRKITTPTSSLGPDFLRVNEADGSQVFNVTDASVDKFWCDISLRVKAIRPLPLYATPHLIG